MATWPQNKKLKTKMHHPHHIHKVGSVATAAAARHHPAHHYHPAHHQTHHRRHKLARFKPRRPQQPKKLAFAMAIILGLAVLAGSLNSRGQARYYPRTISESSEAASIPAASTTLPKTPTPNKPPVKASAPRFKTPATSPAIQHTPQIPVNTAARPYVGSLPDTVPTYKTDDFSFFYAGGREFATATGASASFSQAQPSVPSQPEAENHSLIELAVLSADGKQVIEVGWVVDKVMNGDDLPHLFVYHWVDGHSTCYNACGFVQVSTAVFPGQAVTGSSGTYSIQFSSSAWNIYYNGTAVGYFPASIWGNSFTNFGFVEAFGEVAVSANAATSCIQMGNGLAGSNPGAAKISNFKLTGFNAPEALSPYATVPSSYTYGSASATSVNIGGPGAC